MPFLIVFIYFPFISIVILIKSCIRPLEVEMNLYICPRVKGGNTTAPITPSGALRG